MPDLDLITWFLIGMASILAGLITSAVGSGGMITMPTLFTILPNEPVSTILGINKISVLGGTSNAAVQYARKLRLNKDLIVPAMIMAFFTSMLGSFIASHIAIADFKKGLPIILIGLLIYTLFNKQLGQTVDTKTQYPMWVKVLLNGIVGLYDGLFGPGAGSFFTLLWIKAYGFDFLNATAHAKWVNVATNLGSIAWFGFHGHIYVMLGLFMMTCNVVGSFAGSHITLKYGNVFIRKFFIVIVSCLILKLIYDSYLK